MNALHHSPLGGNATLMETIMKPRSFARRPARWLMAAGLALAAMQGAPAMAQPEADLPEGLDLNPDAPPFFEKIGRQIDCDYVVYRLRFGARGDPAKFLDPEFIAEMQDVRIDLRDTLPAGLEIIDVQVSGDGTAAGGGTAACAGDFDCHQPQRHDEARQLPSVDQRSRWLGRDRPPLRRLRHHGEDRPCGIPGAGDRRQPGLRNGDPRRRHRRRASLARPGAA